MKALNFILLIAVVFLSACSFALRFSATEDFDELTDASPAYVPLPDGQTCNGLVVQTALDSTASFQTITVR